MVSLWPWKSDDTSPASFEKTLSTLSNKIAKATSRLENCRQQGRRFKGLWTLYSSFIYILYVVIVVLVVGWKNWGPVQYTAVSVGPVVIYVVRLGLTAFYDYRTSKLQANVVGLQKQRDTTIDRLKAATKYNTTQQLLEKYGGTPSKPKPSGSSLRNKSPGQGVASATKGGRTGFAPPATANIPGRRGPVSLPSTPQRSSPLAGQAGPAPPLTAAAATPPWEQQAPSVEQAAEFAPNAYAAGPHYAQLGTGPKWYDRFMDLLLGEDETNPKNRIVLICKKCRLVNGQAPPGVRSLEDMERWRCSECGTMNGGENEAKRLVAEIENRAISKHEDPPMAPTEGIDEQVVLVGHDEDRESDVTVYSNEEIGADEGEREGPLEETDRNPAKPKRGRPKGSGKKKS